MEFEWDLSKEMENLQKHRIDFMEAVETFSDPGGFQLRDAKHSVMETRFFWVGKSRNGKVITTRFTHRGGSIRIFGAASWRKFERLYNERTQTK
ncbi:MAG: BrnT family toxin [Acidobacteria bacterium]|nr:BrnT family toxin [Acidobacteriota bacterium]